MKKVYTCFTTDIIHEGHLNIIKEAKKLGSVTVGALSDKALIRYNRFPTVSIEERISLYRSIDGVDDVVIQDDMTYDAIVEKLHPDIIIHGDNWKEGPEKALRDNCIAALKKTGGELVEVGYTYNEKVTKADLLLKEKLAMPEYRRKRLRQLIEICPIVKADLRALSLKRLLLRITDASISLTGCGYHHFATALTEVSLISN